MGIVSSTSELLYRTPTWGILIRISNSVPFKRQWHTLRSQIHSECHSDTYFWQSYFPRAVACTPEWNTPRIPIQHVFLTALHSKSNKNLHILFLAFTNKLNGRTQAPGGKHTRSWCHLPPTRFATPTRKCGENSSPSVGGQARRRNGDVDTLSCSSHMTLSIRLII